MQTLCSLPPSVRSDYCCGPNEHTKAFQEYVAQRGYHLLTVEKYGQLIQQAGFKDVQVRCRHHYLFSTMRLFSPRYQY